MRQIGIFAHSAKARGLFAKALAEMSPDAQVCQLEYPPELGALIHLFQKRGMLDDGVLARMKSTYEEMRK